TYLQSSFKEWFSYYESVESINSVDQFYSILNSLIGSKKNQKLDLYNKRELNDFLTFLMMEADKKKYYDVLLNLTYYREVINSINDKFFESPKFSDIPNLNKSISRILSEKIPENQSLIALSDVGIKTYKIIIEKNNLSAEEIFPDNRIQKNLIFDYLNSIKDNGESVLQQKYIEEIYREKLKLEKNKTTYLYFPSYHFKVYLHPNEFDKFYYILSLEEIIKREASNSHKYFNPPYSFEVSGNIKSGKEKALFGLIDMERKLLPTSKKGKEVHISNEILTLKNNKSLEFNEETIKNLKTMKPKKSAWFYCGSRLGQSSIKNDDFSHSLLYIDKIKEGVGVVSTGLQSDMNTSFFLKEFLKVNGSDSFFERYTDAIKNLKLRFNEDKYWIGYKSYTNVFLR
ncbi:MAG: hypothetical protein EBS19_06480, partial [Spirochaetia bacterium]|nr:hypothetical protein [Spirochaetia bacterium]